MMQCTFVILSICTYIMFGDDDCSSLQEWFEHPIHDQSDPNIESLISRSAQSLRDNNAFIIDPFLSSIGLSLFQKDMLSTHYNKQEIWRSVFQDMGDLDNFSDPNHSRNRVGFVRLGHTNRNDLMESFERLYAYPPLLTFIQAIVLKSGFFNTTNGNLYLSTDREGAIYSLIADPNDKGSWHYDQHPFSCVWMIHKPSKGGVFEMIQLEPTPEIMSDPNDEYWNILQSVWDENESIKANISTIEVREGGLYCFQGNISLHQVTKVDGNKRRGVVVTAYATEKEFQHSDDILNINFVDGIVEVIDAKSEI